VTADVPVRLLKLSAVGEGPEVKWSDNALDLWPGDTQEITAVGLGSRKLLAQYLGSERGTEFVV
jgi:beta-mannosidase